MEKRAGSGLKEKLLIAVMKRSAYNIISNQKVEQIWHPSSQVRKETNIQRLTVYKHTPGPTCLTPSPETSMGIFLPASVGCLDSI